LSIAINYIQRIEKRFYMEREEIVVSVCVVTYNHEKYIKQAIDSVLNQVVDFPIEVIVGEDASTDNTRKILIENYADDKRVKLLLRPENMCQKKEGPNNGYDVRSRAQGKYICFLDGDDYWTDVNYLKRSVNWLENHIDYVGITNRRIILSEKSGMLYKLYDEDNDDTTIDLDTISNNPEILELCSTVFRNYLQDGKYEYRTYLFDRDIGDLTLELTAALHGKIYQASYIIGVHRLDRVSFASNYNNMYGFNETFKKWMHLLKTYPLYYGSSINYRLLKKHYINKFICNKQTKEEFVSSIPFLFKQIGLRDTFITLFKYLKDKPKAKDVVQELRDNQSLLEDKLKIMNYWFINKGIVANYCKLNNFKTVAIYGKGYFGDCIANELDENDISVRYFIDRAAKKLYDERPIKTLDDQLENVDVVIISLLKYSKEVNNEIQKKYGSTTKIVWIEAVIYGGKDI